MHDNCHIRVASIRYVVTSGRGIGGPGHVSPRLIFSSLRMGLRDLHFDDALRSAVADSGDSKAEGAASNRGSEADFRVRLIVQWGE